MRLPGSNVELRLEHKQLRTLEADVLERDITLDEYLNRHRLNATTRLVQMGRQWEDPELTEAQADALIEQAKRAGCSAGAVWLAMVKLAAGKTVDEIPRDLLDEKKAEDAAVAGTGTAGKKTTEPAAVGPSAVPSRRRSA